MRPFIRCRGCFSSFSHVDSVSSLPKMVDIGSKLASVREAHARCFVEFPDDVMKQLTSVNGQITSAKGPVFATAIVAGVMAAKQTHRLIPFCHQVPLDNCNIDLNVVDSRVRVDCKVKTTGKTGVEMEALVGATNAALCVYDMCKALSHDITITAVQLISKTGGKSNYLRDE